ncbi:hypothetical protein [Nocardia caishijiensis]|uniref:Uncharacterized protein n=1 Tax=Nocardia caishijiensis TaxID=184756 RepID=A0ABQ6YKU8_9NOCA|nr:hypothetical protein [Nocardia caishijiensis]KAF0846415.1 hypothetical protein FNL39_105327 [Nocardia caishijiensis]
MTVVEHSAAPADPDVALAQRINCDRVRHLTRLALGLSQDSMDLLTSVTDRLRAAEGALRDPLTSDLGFD